MSPDGDVWWVVRQAGGEKGRNAFVLQESSGEQVPVEDHEFF